MSALSGHPLDSNNIGMMDDHVIQVLKGVSHNVPEEGVIALLGANGGGPRFLNR